MYGDDELLDQYEDELYKSMSDNDGYSSESLDSDLEGAIMGVVQYGTGMQTKTQKNKEKEKEATVEVIEAATPADEAMPSTQVDVQNDILQLESSDEPLRDDDSTSEDSSMDAEDLGQGDTRFTDAPTAKLNTDLPSVTHFIDLTAGGSDQRYLDEESSDEEERELNDKLQTLIADQINNQERSRFRKPSARTCLLCYRTGHQIFNCPIACPDCGQPKHKTDRCFALRYCNQCKRRGHVVEDCTNDKETGACRRCGNWEHHTKHCPSLLHVYIEKKHPPPTPKLTPSCYNCSSKSHYGDECNSLPLFLRSVPSVFSELTLKSGNRYGTKGTSLLKSEGEHYRWSDSSSEVSATKTKNKKYKKGKKEKKGSVDHEQRPYHGRRDHTPYRSESSQRYVGIVDRQLGHFFKNKQSQSPDVHTHFKRGSGSDNWRALGGTVPQPTRSGTLSKKRNEMDFPRGQDPVLPRPSSSGVIDLNMSQSSHKRPRYRGGYGNYR